MQLRPKDYLQTRDGLFCAVVHHTLEQNRVPVTPRYHRDQGGRLHKLQGAAALPGDAQRQYIYHSQFADVRLHAVPLADIKTIWQPEPGLRRLLHARDPDPKQRDAIACIRLLLAGGVPMEQLGITGSLLIGAHNQHSDIDLVVYGRRHFFTLRAHVQQLLTAGKLSSLNRTDWRRAYARRNCALSFDQYLAHEQRKGNKFISGRSRIDLSLLPLAAESIAENGPFVKHGFTALTATVLDDQYSYDYPARYRVDHAGISEIVSYTATYTGQALAGETIEAAGHIEQDAAGKRRLLIGTSRAAANEYIRIKP